MFTIGSVTVNGDSVTVRETNGFEHTFDVGSQS